MSGWAGTKRIGMCTFNNQFIFAYFNSTGGIWTGTSTNGTGWTSNNIPTWQATSAVGMGVLQNNYSSTLVMAYWNSASGNMFSGTSIDGTTWTAHTITSAFSSITNVFDSIGITSIQTSTGCKLIMAFIDQSFNICVGTSPDGITWTNLGVSIATDAKRGVGISTYQAYLGPNAPIYIIYEDSLTRLKYTSSTDGGSTWTTPSSLGYFPVYSGMSMLSTLSEVMFTYVQSGISPGPNTVVLGELQVSPINYAYTPIGTSPAAGQGVGIAINGTNAAIVFFDQNNVPASGGCGIWFMHATNIPNPAT